METTEPDPRAAAPEAAAPEASVSSLAAEVQRAIAGLSQEAEAWAAAAGLVKPLGRLATGGDLEKLLQAADRLGQQLSGLPERSPAEQRAAACLEEIRAAAERERNAMRDRLAKELRALCDARGLSMRVVSREEPVEVRIAPFAVIIDRQRGLAELRFARLPLYGCTARAEDILATRERCLQDLAQGLEPREFFSACQRAWAAARASLGAQSSERVEIAHFLPYLALQMQSKAFSIDPSAENYRTYSRVRFAWDVLRLQRAGLMSCNGWRLNLGVATGTTASAKNRALFLENEDGEGEFKLTVFFTPAPEPS